MIEETVIAEVSMGNTKKEMLDAYDAMKKVIERQRSELMNAEKAKEKLRTQVATAEADKAAAGSPSTQLGQLKQTMARELTRLAEQFDEAVEQYSKLKQAIAEKQEELETIFGVETAAIDLAALLEAQRRKKEEFDEQAKQRRQALDEEIASARAGWEEEKQSAQRERQEEEKRLKQAREREKEDYEYALKREREQRRNELEDQMGALAKEIAVKREEFERDLSNRQSEVGAREKAVTEREQRAADLQAQVEGFPARLEKEVARAVQEREARLRFEFEKTEAFLNKTFEGEKNVLVSKIESLERLAASLADQVRELTARQEKAYQQVQDIASKAVDSSRNVIPIHIPSGRMEDKRE